MSSTKEVLIQAIAPDVARIDQAMRDDLEIATLGCDPLLMEVLHYGIFNGKRYRNLILPRIRHFIRSFDGDVSPVPKTDLEVVPDLKPAKFVDR